VEIPRYFKVATVAQMLGGVTPQFVREEMSRGRFFPVVAGKVDASSVVQVAGNDMISLAGVLWYLHARCAWPKAARAAAFLADELAGGGDAAAFAVLEPGIPARNEGELRRRAGNG
jgi:hypothetical protein